MEAIRLSGVHSQPDLKSLLPIDWQAVTLLGKEINAIQGNPYDGRDLSVLTPPDEAKELVVMVASVIASSRDSRFECRTPTEEDIKRLKPFVATIQRLIGRVSLRWAEGFGKLVERHGRAGVFNAGMGIVQVLEFVRRFEYPRHQFIAQLAKLYRLILEPVLVPSFLGSRELTIEEKIEKMFIALGYDRSSVLDQFNSDEFPLLFALAHKFSFPGPSFSCGQAGVAGAEFMSGIHEFLLRQGIEDLPLPPGASEFDPFNMKGWMRLAAEAFCAEKLELVRDRLPELLSLAVRALPESGPETADAVYRIAERMCELYEQGMPADEICRLLFK